MTREEIINTCGFDPCNYILHGGFNYWSLSEHHVLFWVGGKEFFRVPTQQLFGGLFVKENRCELSYISGSDKKFASNLIEANFATTVIVRGMVLMHRASQEIIVINKDVLSCYFDGCEVDRLRFTIEHE